VDTSDVIPEQMHALLIERYNDDVHGAIGDLKTASGLFRDAAYV
jgi:hypothetical protein